MATNSNIDDQCAHDSMVRQAKALFDPMQTRSLRSGIQAADLERVLVAGTYEEFEAARNRLFNKLESCGVSEERRRRAIAEDALLASVDVIAMDLQRLLGVSDAFEKSEFDEREHYLVDFILCNHSNFSKLMSQYGQRRVGASIARTVIAVRVFDAIAKAYPILREECARQLADHCMRASQSCKR